MRSANARGVVVLLVLLALVLPAVVPAASAAVEGKDSLSYWPTAASKNAQEQENLFMIVMSIALFVFVFVEGLLLYIIFRFRKNKTVPAGETERGHTKAEIVWTIIPAVILLFIGVISAQAMEKIDKIPATDHTIKVTGFQWGWTFEYPDGSQSPVLNVSTGKKYKLDITSRDVIHAVWIPPLGIKLDAVPGRVNSIWFEADDPGEYILKCAEFCNTHPNDSGTGHHSMVTTVGVCKAGTAGCRDFGVDTGPVDTNQVDVVNNLFRPATIRVAAGTTVTWTWREGVHSMTPNNPAQWGGHTGSGIIGSPNTHTFTFNTPGTYEYHCIPHAFQQDGKYVGMVGTVIVT